MLGARYWSGLRLSAAWIGAVASLVLLRWIMIAGVYVAIVEEQRVTRIAGHWTPGFASAATVAGAVVTLLFMAWLTATWLSGRRERAARDAAAVAGHRRVLM